MASHAEAIGLLGPDKHTEFRDAIERLTAIADTVGSEGDLTLLVHQDRSGARVSITLERGEITCLTPTYVPGALFLGEASALHDNECRFERPFAFDVFDADGQMVTPLPMILEDLAIRAAPEPRARIRVELAGLAETVTFFDDEAEYRATGTRMALESLIPSGLFSPNNERDFEVGPRMLMSGTVASAERHEHGVMGGRFAVLEVDSYGGRFVVAVAESDLGVDEYGHPALPPLGSIVSGQFYLSGRIAPNQPPSRRVGDG